MATTEHLLEIIPYRTEERGGGCLPVIASYSLHATGSQSHINCTRVAANRMQIVPVWPPVTCNINKVGRNLHATGGHAGTICMQPAATRVQLACDWRPLGYKTKG